MRQKRDKWVKWIRIIDGEVTHLTRYRTVFWETQEIIKNNERIQRPSSFYGLIGTGYVSLMTMGIRRQIKIDKDSISMASLLCDIHKNPEAITRKWFLQMYAGRLPDRLANLDFDRFAGPNSRFVDPQPVAEDLKVLFAASRKCEDYADKKIAHLDKRGPKSLVRFRDIDNSVNVLGKLLKKYLRLLTGESRLNIDPEPQYDWKAVLRTPWIETKVAE